MKNTIYILLGLILLSSCLKEENVKDFNTIDVPVNSEVILNDSLYNYGETDYLTIVSARIDGDYMKVEYYARGCSGDDWTTELAVSNANDAEGIYRDSRILLNNDEPHDDLYSKIASFDLRPLRAEGEDRVYLELSGQSFSILMYEY